MICFGKQFVMDKNTNNFDGKIIKLPYNNTFIEDDDIMSLMSGLISLARKNATLKTQQIYASLVQTLKKEIALLKLENRVLRENNKKCLQH